MASNMAGVPPSRLVSKPFIAVTAAALAFFTYVGMLVPLVPTFISDELGAGELGVGLSLATFAAAAICVRPLIGRLVEHHGRRAVMVGGSLLAGVAGFLCSTVHSLAMLLVLRGVAGIGEAALFVGAATLVADLAPPHRRAEAASYFSVAVFGGLGIGPIIGDAVLGTDDYGQAFLVAGAFAWLAALVSLFVPGRVPSHFVDVPTGDLPGAPRLAADHAPGRRRPRARAGVRHRRVRGVHGVLARVLRGHRLRRFRRSVRGVQRRLPAAAPRRRPAGSSDSVSATRRSSRSRRWAWRSPPSPRSPTHGRCGLLLGSSGSRRRSCTRR